MDSWIAVRLAVVIQLWRGSVKHNILHCESTTKQQFFCRAKVGAYRPFTTRVTLEIELWASGEDVMRDGEGAPIDVQLSIFQLSRVDAEAPDVARDD